MKPSFMEIATRTLDALGLSPKSRLDKKARVFTHSEYWVYLPKAVLPVQDAVMARLFDTRVITPTEGLLFSDVRLHTVLVLKAKNMRLFRKDLLLKAEGFGPQSLELVETSEAIARVSYISETPLNTRTHVRLLPHLALALADLGESPIVFDLMQQKLYRTEELRDVLREKKDASSLDVQVRVSWQEMEQFPTHYFACSYGMAKRGLPDLTTGSMPADAQNLAVHLVEAAVDALWKNPEIVYSLPHTVTVSYFDETFLVTIERRAREGKLFVRLFRAVGLAGEPADPLGL